MASYTYHGDHPVDIPALALMDVQPGDTVTASEIVHPDFQQVG